MKNIIILTNILTPYRKFFYDKLFEELKKQNYNLVVVIMADTENGRHWNYDDFKTEYTHKLEGKTKKICGIEIHFNKEIKEIYDGFRPVCVICGGSYLYPSVWQTIKLQKKYKYTLFEWSESHLNEKRDYGKLKLYIRNLIRKKIIGSFEYFWNPGKFAMEFVKKYSPNAKCIYAPNLIDSSKFNISNKTTVKNKGEFELSSSKRNFFTPARLSSVKGIIEFLQLYKECDTKNARYIIAGDGELREEIQRYIDENNLDVHLIGYRNEEEIISLYSQCDGMILPSLSDSNPLSCVEALWSGLPLLVSTHVGNYPEVVEKNKNGYVFNYEKRQEAIKTINKFINQDDNWYKNAENVSLSIADKMYNPDKAIKNIVKETIKICEGEKND